MKTSKNFIRQGMEKPIITSVSKILVISMYTQTNRNLFWGKIIKVLIKTAREIMKTKMCLNVVENYFTTQQQENKIIVNSIEGKYTQIIKM